MDAVQETQQPGTEEVSETNAEVPQESVMPEPPPAAAEEKLDVSGREEVVESAQTEPKASSPDKSPEPTHEEAKPLPEPESKPQAPQADETSAPVAEPETAQLEQSKDPEPIPLADDSPEPAPEEKVELQALAAPVELLTGQEEAVSGKAEAQAVTPKQEGAAPVVASQEVAAEVVKDPEAVAAIAATGEPATAEMAKVVESAPGGAVEPSTEKRGGHPPKEIVLGSFGFLGDDERLSLATSRTMVILRGLPGSGKTTLASAIAETYPGSCCVVRGDDHGVKPESSPEASADAYKAIDDAVATHCATGTAATAVIVVVDDTNHTQDRLARLGEVAEEQRLVALFLEPRTPWRRDVAQLGEKSSRGLDKVRIEAMMRTLEETDIPLFFGWFLLPAVQEKVACTSMDFLKTLDTLDVFKKHMIDFTPEPDKEVDLEQYFESKGALHCTAKFCDYGKAEGAKAYSEELAVQDLYGTVSELSLVALFVTPRTFGARVCLTAEQMVLWANDDTDLAKKKKVAEGEKEAEPTAAALPPGSRAHVTLGCADGVEAVQTGLDLLEILGLGEVTVSKEEMELGSLAYYGEGRWLLTLREPIDAPACFSSYFAAKAEETKKESEKKKKPKCVIL